MLNSTVLLEYDKKIEFPYKKNLTKLFYHAKLLIKWNNENGWKVCPQDTDVPAKQEVNIWWTWKWETEYNSPSWSCFRPNIKSIQHTQAENLGQNFYRMYRQG